MAASDTARNVRRRLHSENQNDSKYDDAGAPSDSSTYTEPHNAESALLSLYLLTRNELMKYKKENAELKSELKANEQLKEKVDHFMTTKHRFRDRFRLLQGQLCQSCK